MASPDCDNSPWRPIGADEVCDEWGTDDGWILATGFWDDLGFWRDIAVWNDGAPYWEK